MPELAEENTFRACLERFITEIKSQHGPQALQVLGLYADVKDSELDDMAKREQRLLNYASTLRAATLQKGFHVVWATRLERLADAVPDTHGLLIAEAREKFPEIFKTQISPNHTSWPAFCRAICSLQDGVIVQPEKNPDRRYTADIPPRPDTAWEDPIPSPMKVFPSPRAVHDAEHGDVFSPTAPASLASPGSSKVKISRSKAAVAREKDLVTNTRLLSFNGFTKNSKNSNSIPRQSVAGASSHLEGLGVTSTHKRPKKPELCTDRDIDHSLYLWPCYLFPGLDDPAVAPDVAFLRLGLELLSVEYDPRSIILYLKKCYIEIEPLLHTSPQFFINHDFFQLMRVPAKHRGFKVVIALRLDVLFDYWQWCEFVVSWLKQQDDKPHWDMHSFAEVLSMPGNHPMRAVGRYSEDEIAYRSGVPLWTLWRDVRLNPKLMCAVLETFFMFTLERYLAIDRKKKLVSRYNAMSILSYIDEDVNKMKNAPWTFDLADLAPALGLFGHMGPGIVDDWTDMYEAEARLAYSVIPPEMKNLHLRFTGKNLTAVQRLGFKALIDLTTDELDLLTTTYKSATNPVVAYYQKKSRLSLMTKLSANQPQAQPRRSTRLSGVDSKPPSQVPLSPPPSVDFVDSVDSVDATADDDDESQCRKPGFLTIVDPLFEMKRLNAGILDAMLANEESPHLTLIRDPGRQKLVTRLCKGHKGKSFSAGRCTLPNDKHTPVNALVYSEIIDRVRRQRTLCAIKVSSKLYTVGPMDFCGHAKAIQRGRGWLISLCQWDPTLPPKDQLFMKSSWDAIGTWPKGFSKHTKGEMTREINSRSKIRNQLQKNWTLDRDISDEDVNRGVRRQKKEKKDKAKAKAKKGNAK
ncbi:hypothetical protein K438DRAFT_1765291 [Mycena galopus ATCC 62051]|nr:hypothetical protein K438DRAFT_1765291 [Mycena galopus ATCC 62051]